MTQTGADPGTQLVLDSRKMIVGFLILIAVCGTFFVIGYMEGKRQCVQTQVNAVPPPAGAATADPGAAAAMKSDVSPPQDAQTVDRSARAPLDWYKNVQGGKSEAGAGNPPQTANSEKKAAPAVPPAPSPAAAEPKAPARSALPAAGVFYTVQVGAFRQRREAESNAAALKAKGYVSILEEPRSPKQLFLIKVGRFSSRADAKAMQLRLQKDGFSSFVKVN